MCVSHPILVAGLIIRANGAKRNFLKTREERVSKGLALWQVFEGRALEHKKQVPAGRRVLVLPLFVSDCSQRRKLHGSQRRIHTRDQRYDNGKADGAEGKAVSAFVHDLVTAAGGSISAEHGIGQMKRAELGRRSEESAPPSAAARIEVADLKERIRKLEAIAAGVDL